MNKDEHYWTAIQRLNEITDTATGNGHCSMKGGRMNEAELR